MPINKLTKSKATKRLRYAQYALPTGFSPGGDIEKSAQVEYLISVVCEEVSSPTTVLLLMLNLPHFYFNRIVNNAKKTTKSSFKANFQMGLLFNLLFQHLSYQGKD